MFFQLLANGIIAGALYALIALGFALVYNTTRIFHIAFAAIFVTSPYFFLTLYETLGVPFILASLLAIIFTSFLSLGIEIVIYQPLIKRSRSANVAMVSSIGAMIIIINSIALFYGNETKIFDFGMTSSLMIGNTLFTNIQIAQFLVSLVIMGAFFGLLRYSKFGITTRALRDDEQLCKIMGVNIKHVRFVLFLLSGSLAAIGSLMIAWDVGMNPYAGMPILLNVVVAIILGGIGRFDAAVIGGFIIGVIQAMAVWAFSSRWQDAITFGLLISVLAFRNNALLGEKERPV